MDIPAFDHTLPLETRVSDLISRMRPEEKLGFLPARQKAVPRLGVDAYNVGGEGAHGLLVRRGYEQRPSGESTVFPQPIGLSCTWDKDLMRRVGTVIGDEARVWYKKDGGSHWLTLWFPTIDMERDPRWGRTEEAYGEDPFLAGQLAAALIRGVRGDDPYYVKATCAPKHFFGNNTEKNRLSSSTDISERVKHEYYLRVFKYAFTEGGALSLMTAYNEINGVPCIVIPEILSVVKGEWGCEGFIVCDGDDLIQTVTHHHYCETSAEAVALALKAGVDCFPDQVDEKVEAAATEAYSKGLFTDEELDRALTNIMRIRFRLGQFDPPGLCPYDAIPEDRLCCEEHSAIALEAAKKGVVLLKNDGILPLDPAGCGNVLVLGDLAESNMADWYSGRPPHTIAPLDAIRAALPAGAVNTVRTHDTCAIFNDREGGWLRVGGDGAVTFDGSAETRSVFEEIDWGFGSVSYLDLKTGKYLNVSADCSLGCTASDVWGWFTMELFFRDEDTGRFVPHGGTFNDRFNDEEKGIIDSLLRDLRRETLSDGITQAVNAASKADTVLLVLGNHPLINGREGFDRPDIAFPRRWTGLIGRLYEVNRNIILTLIAGYPYAFPEEEKLIRAAIYTAHGEQYAGAAVADTLFGGNNPAGRLSMTWYKSAADLPDIDDYDIINNPRTYMYFEKPVQYPFGHGLSYTEFDYTGLSISREAGGYTVSCCVRNTGARAGEEVAQLYATPEGVPVKAPIRRLCGFERLRLEPGEAASVLFRIPDDELRLYDEKTGAFSLTADRVRFSAGASSDDIRAELTTYTRGC